MHRLPARWWVPALAAAFVVACNETPVSLPEPSSIVLSGTTVTLVPTETVTLSAQVLDNLHDVVTSASPIWASDNPGVARVVAGTVTAVAVGTANISASYGNLTASAVVTVSAPALTITPRAVQLYPGYTQGLYAKVTGSAGQEVFPTVTWTAVDPSVAQLSNSAGSANSVGARKQGTTRIVASVLGKADTVAVTVVADERSLVVNVSIIPDALTYDATSATPLLVDYRMQDGYGYEQCSNYNLGFRFNTSVISSVWNQGKCQFQITPTGTPGTVYVYASINNIVDSVLVTINSIAYSAAFSKFPPDSTIRAGDTVQYTVTVLNEANQPAAGVAVNFDVTGGALSSTGVTTGAAGTAAVSWYLPSKGAGGVQIPPTGTGHAIDFQLEFPSGATSAQYSRVATVIPNAVAKVMLLGNFTVGLNDAPPSPAVDTLPVAAAVGINLANPYSNNTNMRLFAQSFDKFGNPRQSAVSWSADDASAILSPATSGSQSSVLLHGDRLRTNTVIATEGPAADTVTITWTAGPMIVFQTLSSNQIWTGQPYTRTSSTGFIGDTVVYNGGGTAWYPTWTLRTDTLAFGWNNGGAYDIGLVASNGSNAATPVSTVPAAWRSFFAWGFPGFVGGSGAWNVLFLSENDPAKNASTGSLANTFSATATGYARATGSFLTDGFAAGEGINVAGFANSANNGRSIVTSVTALALGVQKAGGTVAEAAGANFVSISGVHVWDLYLRQRGNPTPTKVTNTAGLADTLSLRGISIKPDGSKALLIARYAAAPSQVIEVSLADGSVAPVTSNTDPSTFHNYAAYSPDGTVLYIDRTTSGVRELIETTASGSRVLRTNLGESEPNFDPTTASRLAYLSNASVNGELRFFTLPSGADAMGRTNLRYFTWSRR